MKLISSLLIAILALSGCASDGTSLATTSTTAASQAAIGSAIASASLKPASSRTTARGFFVGENDHVTKGTVDVFRYKGGWFIHLGPNFSLEGAPDPKVALGNSKRGGFQSNTILAKLDNLNGEQVYALKSGIDIADYDQIYIWCEKFNVSLGRADLTLL